MKKHGVINNSLYLFGNIWKESKLQFLLIFFAGAGYDFDAVFASSFA